MSAYLYDEGRPCRSSRSCGIYIPCSRMGDVPRSPRSIWVQNCTKLLVCIKMQKNSNTIAAKIEAHVDSIGQGRILPNKLFGKIPNHCCVDRTYGILLYYHPPIGERKVRLIL